MPNLMLILMLFLAALPGTEPAHPSARLSSSPSHSQLARGVNVPIWFWLQGQGGTGHFEAYFTSHDAQILRTLGFTHVRLPVDVSLFFDPETPQRLLPSHLDALENAVRLLIDNGLAVIIVPYGETSDFLSDPEQRTAASSFWLLFASFLSRFDANDLFMEVVHEPSGPALQWWSIQSSLLAHMRLVAPNHTLIAVSAPTFDGTQGDGDTLSVLVEMTPYPDPNVIYGVPFFDPPAFTLQGSDWAGWYGLLRGIPYPSTSDNVRTIAEELRAEMPDDLLWVPDAVLEYGSQHWGAERIERTLAPALAWASRNGVELLVHEFGVVRSDRVGSDDRNQWLADVVALLERNGIGWTLWDYSDAFGLMTDSPTGRIIDVQMARALGLTVVSD